MNSDFSNAKIGDIVAIDSGHGLSGNAIRLGNITHLTKTMFEVDGRSTTRYRRSDGRVVGGDSWNMTHAYLPTPEEIDEIRANIEKHKKIGTILTMTDRLGRLRREQLDLATLDQIQRVLNELSETEDYCIEIGVLKPANP